jgi:hypothetical protein
MKRRWLGIWFEGEKFSRPTQSTGARCPSVRLSQQAPTGSGAQGRKTEEMDALCRVRPLSKLSSHPSPLSRALCHDLAPGSDAPGRHRMFPTFSAVVAEQHSRPGDLRAVEYN